jgi:hypothetical protein
MRCALGYRRADPPPVIDSRMKAAAALVRRARVRRRSRLPHTGRIFGIGLSRTATTTLTAALEQLGFRARHFPSDEPSRIKVERFIADGGPSLTLPVLDALDAVTDTPVCATFEGLDAGYPGSLFVLTVRDKRSWLESCAWYWTTQLEPFVREHPDHPLAAYSERLDRALYGGPGFDDERFSAAYDRYHSRVAEHFRDRPSDLLRFDICAGADWEPLCRFLDVSRPAVAFPRQGHRRPA